MMKRTAEGYLGTWIEKKRRKPLILLGARQTGKSTLVRMFASKNGLLLNEINLEQHLYLDDVFKRFQPEIVFHLAAQPLVRLSYSEPVETFQTNVMGTVNVFEACRQTSSVRAVINITSDKCYENREWVWGYRENDPMGGYDPYSASKGCAELVTSAYRNSFFHLDEYGNRHNALLASARTGNVISGGDWAKDRIITDLMEAVSRGKKLYIRNPNSTRPWQHVLESLSGYLQLGQKLLEGKKSMLKPGISAPVTMVPFQSFR